MRISYKTLVTAFFLLFTLPVLAQSVEEDGKLLSGALLATAAEDWVTADFYAGQMSDSVGVDLVIWQRLRRGEGDWAEYVDFLDQNPDWPGLKRLRLKGEATIPANQDPAKVRAYFTDQLPQTGTGSLRLAEAFTAQGRVADARREALRAWGDLTLTAGESDKLLKRYKGVLARHHQTRLDNLLWSRRTKAAERMLDLVPPGHRKLAKARIALQRASKGVDAAIAAVPKNLQDDPGLAFDRFIWRLKKNRWDDAQAMIVERSGNVETLGRPEAWSSRRRTFARRAMRAGENDLAYWLASQHELKSGSDYADLEWLAGYIALTKLDAPEQAMVHFKNHRNAVKSPISLGRAGYWMGQAADALDDHNSAIENYEFGAQFQTSFYGQLAAEKIGFNSDSRLATGLKVGDWRDADFAKSGPVRAGILLHYADKQNLMRWFFTHVAGSLNETEAVQLADIALELGRPYVALGVAKEVAKRGIVIPRSYFPVTELATLSGDVEPEVAMAIARRESELNPEAVSPAGARGLMQIMPKTARKVAKETDTVYSKARLTTDWRYNAKLGTAYLGGLLKIYGGSYVLAFAAYNAGPRRADKWIEQFGDPRDPTVDEVNWIEHIPYRETRNYVMRVMESLHVYRARLKGRAVPLQLLGDLARG